MEDWTTVVINSSCKDGLAKVSAKKEAFTKPSPQDESIMESLKSQFKSMLIEARKGDLPRYSKFRRPYHNSYKNGCKSCCYNILT